MIAVKVARSLGDVVLKDNSMDMAGYAACLFEIEEENSRKESS